MSDAFIFPGQGSQSVGMGRELFDTFAEAREVFQEVDEVLKQKLSKLIFEGPIETLTLTENTQPALMTVSLAVIRVLEKQSGKKLQALASFVAGHSLGEYSALCSAESLSLADTAKLLRLRGQSMQQAAPAGSGKMAAVLGVELQLIEKLCAEASNGDDLCQVANDNSTGQVVISGAAGAIDRAEELLKSAGAKRVVMLNVSAPFHSALIQPAAKIMQNALDETQVKKPVIPLIANVIADSTTDPDEIRNLLVQQVTGRVRWRESVEALHHKGVTRTVEIGAGKVLTGLTKRIVDSMEAIAINNPKDIEALLG